MIRRKLVYSQLVRAEGAPAAVLEVVWQGWVPRLAAPSRWRPPLDICETARALHVKAEIAGLDEDDLEVSLHDQRLTIEGERRWAPPAGDAHVHVSELRYGPFQLELQLPEALLGAPWAWSYERGILEVVIRKEEVDA